MSVYDQRYFETGYLDIGAVVPFSEKAVFGAAHNLLVDHKWMQDDWACDRDGWPVKTWRKSAVRFCAGGALNRAVYDLGHFSRNGYDRGYPERDILSLVDAVCSSFLDLAYNGQAPAPEKDEYTLDLVARWNDEQPRDPAAGSKVVRAMFRVLFIRAENRAHQPGAR